MGSCAAPAPCAVVIAGMVVLQTFMLIVSTPEYQLEGHSAKVPVR